MWTVLEWQVMFGMLVIGFILGFVSSIGIAYLIQKNRNDRD